MIKQQPLYEEALKTAVHPTATRDCFQEYVSYAKMVYYSRNKHVYNLLEDFFFTILVSIDKSSYAVGFFKGMATFCDRCVRSYSMDIPERRLFRNLQRCSINVFNSNDVEEPADIYNHTQETLQRSISIIYLV